LSEIIFFNKLNFYEAYEIFSKLFAYQHFLSNIFKILSNSWTVRQSVYEMWFKSENDSDIYSSFLLVVGEIKPSYAQRPQLLIQRIDFCSYLLYYTSAIHTGTLSFDKSDCNSKSIYGFRFTRLFISALHAVNCTSHHILTSKFRDRFEIFYEMTASVADSNKNAASMITKLPPSTSAASSKYSILHH